MPSARWPDVGSVLPAYDGLIAVLVVLCLFAIHAADQSLPCHRRPVSNTLPLHTHAVAHRHIRRMPLRHLAHLPDPPARAMSEVRRYRASDIAIDMRQNVAHSYLLKEVADARIVPEDRERVRADLPQTRKTRAEGEHMNVASLAAAAREIVDTNRYLTLATANAGGEPWASPLWYAHAGYREFLWVSRPATRYARHIAVRPEVAIVLFDSTAPVGAAPTPSGETPLRHLRIG